MSLTLEKCIHSKSGSLYILNTMGWFVLFTAKKMKFFIKDYVTKSTFYTSWTFGFLMLSGGINADLVTFTEQILIAKLHYLCSVFVLDFDIIFIILSIKIKQSWTFILNSFFLYFLFSLTTILKPPLLTLLHFLRFFNRRACEWFWKTVFPLC